MTYNTAKYMKFEEQPFSKGMVDNIQPNLLADSMSPYLRNGRLDGYGIRKRPWRTLFATTNGVNKGGIFAYNRAPQTNNRIIARTNIDSTHKLASMDSNGTVVSVNTGSGITSDNYMNFTQWGDTVYCLNGADGLGMLTGDIYTNKTLVVPNSSVTFDHIVASASGTVGQSVFTLGSPYFNFGSTSLPVNTQLYFTNFSLSDPNLPQTYEYVYQVVATTGNVGAGPWTVDVVSGLTTVTGLSGTQFSKWFYVGGTITANAETHNIAQIIDDTHLVTSTAWGSSGSFAYTAPQVYLSTIEPLSTSSVTQPSLPFNTATFTVSSGLSYTQFSSATAWGASTPHGYSVGNTIQFSNSVSTLFANNAVPAPLTEWTTYYIQSVPTTSTFTVSATSGGPAITLTTLGNPVNETKALSVINPVGSVIFNNVQVLFGDTTNPDSIYTSVATNYSDFTSAGSNVYKFNEPLTGLAITSETLFYFSPRSVWTTGLQDVSATGSYIQRPTQAQEWSVNMQSIVPAGIQCFYLSPSNKIWQLQRARSIIYGFEATCISHVKYKGIQKFLESLPTNQTQSVGYYHSEQLLIKWFLRDWNSPEWVNNICLIYDITKDAWLIDTGCIHIGVTYANDIAYAVSAYNGNIYVDEDLTTTNDDNSPIPFFYASKHWDAGEPSMKKQFWEVRTFLSINDQTNLTQNTYVDGALINTQNILNGPTYILLTDVNGTPIFDVNGSPIDVLFDEEQILPATGGISSLPIGTYPISSENLWANNQDISIIVSKGDLYSWGRWRYIQLTWEDNSLNSYVQLQQIMIKQETLSPLTLNRTDSINN